MAPAKASAHNAISPAKAGREWSRSFRMFAIWPCCARVYVRASLRASALEVLHLMRAEGRTLAELADEMQFWPQVTRNVKAARRRDWEKNDAFRAAKLSAEASLGSTGRLLVRPSGTEPVLRITVEAQNSTLASSTADELARVAAKELV